MLSLFPTLVSLVRLAIRLQKGCAYTLDTGINLRTRSSRELIRTPSTAKPTLPMPGMSTMPFLLSDCRSAMISSKICKAWLSWLIRVSSSMPRDGIGRLEGRPLGRPLPVAAAMADARTPEGITETPEGTGRVSGALGIRPGATVGRGPKDARAEEIAREAIGGIDRIGAIDTPGAEGARGVASGGALRGGRLKGGGANPVGTENAGAERTGADKAGADKGGPESAGGDRSGAERAGAENGGTGALNAGGVPTIGPSGGN